MQHKLIAGIVVDQMRYDYMAKYYSKFSENVLKKRLNSLPRHLREKENRNFVPAC